jgi:hypothetical protein
VEFGQFLGLQPVILKGDALEIITALRRLEDEAG